MPQKMIIDTDTASDDAVALMMALRHPDIEVEAITIVSGNVSLEQGSINARYTVELCGKNTPVYEGLAKPLMRERYYADWYHGKDGMGDMNYPAPTNAPMQGHAVDALIEIIKANPGIMLVTLGPMTNVAAALTKAPEIIQNISRCVVMGGAACTVGNVTPAAEYNIWCDPEAARICFRSGLPIEMVGWELSWGEANLMPEDIQYCREIINTPFSHFTVDCNRIAMQVNMNWSGEPGLGLCDPIAMAVAIDPTICTRSSKHFVEIECDGLYTRGMTIVDQRNVARHDVPPVEMWRFHRAQSEPKVAVCWEIDPLRWKELLYSLMR